MASFRSKPIDKLVCSTKAILQRRSIFLPRRSEFGLHTAKIFLPSPKLTFREKSYKITSFSQQGEDLILNRILQRRLGINPRKRVGFYMDVGAYHPISHSTSYCLYKFGWTGVCVDISRETCKLIEKVRPRDRVFHAAISDADGKHNAVSVEDISLVNEANYDILGKQKNTLIDSRSISSILDEMGKMDRIDYLNIDVEGAELAALGGLDFERHRPKVISIEIHDTDMLAALDTDVARKIRGEGYVPVGCAAITYFFVYSGDLS